MKMSICKTSRVFMRFLQRLVVLMVIVLACRLVWLAVVGQPRPHFFDEDTRIDSNSQLSSTYDSSHGNEEIIVRVESMVKTAGTQLYTNNNGSIENDEDTEKNTELYGSEDKSELKVREMSQIVSTNKNELQEKNDAKSTATVTQLIRINKTALDIVNDMHETTDRVVETTKLPEKNTDNSNSGRKTSLTKATSVAFNMTTITMINSALNKKSQDEKRTQETRDTTSLENISIVNPFAANEYSSRISDVSNSTTKKVLQENASSYNEIQHITNSSPTKLPLDVSIVGTATETYTVNELNDTNGDKGKAVTETIVSTKQTSTKSSDYHTNYCESIVPWGQAYHAKVSSYDLLAKANYTMDESGNYPIPIKTVSELTEDTNRDVVSVFLVPFSHADPGYGLTIEQYYKSKTHATLNNMIEKLTAYPNMTFQWAETVFLARWFQDLNEDKKQQVRELLKSGRLEIVLGGWVMPDEASTHYVSVVDQLIEGHQWLLENLGVKPRQAWVNDPFGYSSTMPYLWKSAGMDNMVFLRIDQAVKAQLMKTKSLEFKWRPYWKRTNSSDMLATIMPYTNYWIGDVCGPFPAICNEFSFINMDKTGETKVVKVTNENVAKQAEIIYEQFLITADLYAYNSLYIGLGEDFSYSRPAEWDNLYENYNKIIDYINSRKDWRMNIKFGTLHEYFANVRNEQRRLADKVRISGSTEKLDFPSLSGDFYPYTEKKQEYWTGYFTTRPLNKRFARDLETLVYAADVFNVLTFSLFKHYWVKFEAYTEVARDLQMARRELGMFLHHDGLTGTSLPHVVRDYELRLFKAHSRVQSAFKILLISLLSKGKNQQGKYLQEELVKPGPRQIMQKIIIDVTREQKIVLVNTLSRRRRAMVTLCVNSKNIHVTSATKKYIPYQVNEWSVSKNSNCRTTVTVPHELPAFGIEVLTLGPNSLTENVRTIKDLQLNVDSNNDISIENQYMKVEFDKHTGMMTKIIDTQGRVTNMSCEFMVYQSLISGAYLFGPKGNAMRFKTGEPVISVSRGIHVSEVRVGIPGLLISFTLYNSSSISGHGIHIRTEIDLAAVKIQNMEVVLRFNTDVKSGLNFFTDQNGYQLMGRKRRVGMPIEANYYPISTMMLIEDAHKRVTLHTKQSHGASSLEEGQFEVMLDRHTFRDDGRGLGQGVYDNVKVNGDFVLQTEYIHSDQSNREPRYTFPTEDAALINEMVQNKIMVYSVLDTPATFLDKIHPLKQFELPCDVSVVALRNIIRNNLEYNNTSLVLRRHAFLCSHSNVNDQCTNRQEIMSISDMFPNLKATVTETSLSLLYDKTTLNRDSNIMPGKMELRTFKLEF